MNNVQPNVIGNYIKVANMSSPSFLMRYRGTSNFPHVIADFLSLPFGSGQTKLTSFPDYANFTELVFEKYSVASQTWTEFFRTTFTFPGTFCYNVLGPLEAPQVENVPCTDRISITNDICFNNNNICLNNNNSCYNLNNMYNNSDTLCYNVNNICGNTSNVCYRPTPNPLTNYIRVFNKTTSSTLLRYRGNCVFPSLTADFIALPFIKGEDVLTSFPPFAGFTNLSVEGYDLTSRMWVSIFADNFTFPGTFCYEAVGSTGSIQVNKIPCPPL